MAKKEFDLNQELRVTIDNGVNSFDYKVIAIYYNSRTVECSSEDGLNLYSFSFEMIGGLGSIYINEDAEPNAPPADDKPIDLSEVPF